MSLLRFLGIGGSQAGRDAEPQSLIELAAELDSLPEDESRFVAAFAYLLARVAGSDFRIDASEVEAMAQHLETFGGVSASQAQILAKSALRTAEAYSPTDDHLVARAFSDMSDAADRQRLVRCLYAIAAADENISTREDNEIFEVAGAIGMDRPEVVALRSEFKTYLGSLKALPSER